MKTFVIDEETLAWALHRYWHTDDAWGNIVTKEEDMEHHLRNARGILATMGDEGDKGTGEVIDASKTQQG